MITGMNRDEGGADSNGAGKTSLVAAPLWALTGDMLARTEVGGGSDQNGLGAESRGGARMPVCRPLDRPGIRHGRVQESSASSVHMMKHHGWFCCSFIGFKLGQFSQHYSAKSIHPLSAGENLVGRPSVISFCNLSH